VEKHTSLVYCDRTDIGRRRSSNQDAMAVLPANAHDFRTRGWMFLVADGMGAHAAGELASAMAASLVPRVYANGSDFSPPLALRQSLEQINREIHRKGESGFEFKGMGTTCTTLVLLPRGVIIGHVGDSRCYRIRGRTIEQLSRDHSLVWELETAGGMSRQQAADAAPKNIITRSMGPHPHVDVDMEGPFPVAAGDVYLLCSDGLSGQVTDEEIGLLGGGLEPAVAVPALIGLALVRGAPDNVTVIAARAGPEEATAPSRKDDPWPLSIEATANRRQARHAWIALICAAVFLLAALVFNPLSPLVKDRCDAAPLVRAICLFGSIGAAAAALAAGLFALPGLLSPPRGRLLHSDEHLGKGPYRRYDCTPSVGLVEGIAASVTGALGDMSESDRHAAQTLLDRAREQAAAGNFADAMPSLAEAIAIHTRAVEAGRRDDTVRAPTPKPAHPAERAGPS
jgi:serine/threonine protein phosphatase PrpC